MIDDSDVPYNNDNFYPLNGEQRMPFNFHGTYPSKIAKDSKRPQSASIRVQKDSAPKQRITKRNQINGELRRSNEGGFIAASAPSVKEGMRESNYQQRDHILLNHSNFIKSPSKFQK